MGDAQNKKFDVLICYRPDRVSKNVADFSATIEELEQVEYIYDKYLELKSINQVRKYTMVNNIRNYKGAMW